MARTKVNLTEIIHLRISEATKNNLEEIASSLGLSYPDTCRLALAIFIWLWQKLSDVKLLKRWVLGFVENKDE